MDTVAGERVIQVQGEGDVALVLPDHPHQVLAELLGEHGRSDVHAEAGEKIVRDVPQQGDFPYLKGVRGRFPLGALLRLQEEFLLHDTFKKQRGLGLHVLHEGLVVLPEEREFVGAAVVLQHGAGIGLARFGSELLKVRHNASHIHLGGLFVCLAVRHKVPQIGQFAVGEVVHLELVTV